MALTTGKRSKGVALSGEVVAPPSWSPEPLVHHDKPEDRAVGANQPLDNAGFGAQAAMIAGLWP